MAYQLYNCMQKLLNDLSAVDADLVAIINDYIQSGNSQVTYTDLDEVYKRLHSIVNNCYDFSYTVFLQARGTEEGTEFDALNDDSRRIDDNTGDVHQGPERNAPEHP